MAVVEKSVLIERTPIQMFDLVDQVELYPQFLPWCGGTEVLERTDGRTVATLRVDFRGLKTHFTTENDKQKPTLMTLKLKDGPFRLLEGSWRFIPLGDAACKIEFKLNYEFSSRLLDKALAPVFNHIANTFVESFVKRAEQVYG